jgi:hypothetical protein
MDEVGLSRGSVALRRLLDEGEAEHAELATVEAAEAVKAAVHRTQLWRYLRGKSPTVELAARIERESGGRIPAAWWGEPAEPEQPSDSTPTEAA